MAKQVLIVEDEFLVAMLLEDLLVEMGHRVVASATQLSTAMSFAEETDFDFAILDINLGGMKSFPVAEVLRRRGIPFVFATGYGTDGLTDQFRNVWTLQKPYDPRELKWAIDEVSAQVSGQSPSLSL